MENEIVAFGMTKKDIADYIDAQYGRGGEFSGNKNRTPERPFSYQNYIETVNKGHELLKAQKGYFKYL